MHDKLSFATPGIPALLFGLSLKKRGYYEEEGEGKML